MTFRRWSSVCLLAAGIVSLTACDLSSNGGGNPIGIAVLAARTKGTGYTTGPEVAFYRVSSATFITAGGVTDSCVAATYSETTTGGNSGITPLSGGASVVIRMSGRTDTLLRNAGGTDPT